VQLSGIFEDSKDFVDRPMLEDPETILYVSASRQPTIVSSL